MQRCETCKWWGKDDPAFSRHWNWDERPVLDDGTGRRPCTLTLMIRGEPQHPTKAVVYGHELLYTEPDFGCVQHEPKDDN